MCIRDRRYRMRQSGRRPQGERVQRRGDDQQWSDALAEQRAEADQRRRSARRQRPAGQNNETRARSQRRAARRYVAIKQGETLSEPKPEGAKAQR